MTDFDSNSAKMLTEQRRRRIIELLQSSGVVNAEELVSAFKVSQMTVWRDLIALEKQGKLRRVRGGAARLDDLDSEPLYRSKQVINKETKRAIALYAAQHFVEADDIIILEAGTTVGAMISFLRQPNLTIMTNGLGNLNELSLLVPDAAVLSCGGILRDVALTFVGPQAEEFFRAVRARTLFLGATGLTISDGITDPNPLEIQVKRVMAESASRVVLLIDSSKFGLRSLTPILPFERIAAIITDAAAPLGDLDELRRRGLDVHVVQ
jgi:DeoR/GlpR family transcriptional regulator of sugar metabolism